MKIVVLDGYAANPGDLSWDRLKKYGDLTVYDRTQKEDTVKRIADAEIVFTNKVLITKEVMDICINIKYIGILATGYNVIDLDYAHKKGITVCNVPAYSTDGVAQLTIAMLLEICRNVALHNRAVKDGEWCTCPDFSFWKCPMIELAGKTLGIVGFGSIGKAVADIARAMKMKVVYTNNRKMPVENSKYEYVDIDTLFKTSDIITLHCPLTEDTENLIRKENIDKMKDGCIIINTSRGPVVNEKDLKDALDSGKVYAAAVDVVSKEPIESDNPLLDSDCIITPHIAWAAKETRQRLLDIAMDNLKCYLDGNSQNVI